MTGGIGARPPTEDDVKLFRDTGNRHYTAIGGLNLHLDDYGTKGEPGQIVMIDEHRKRKWVDMPRAGGSL